MKAPSIVTTIPGRDPFGAKIAVDRGNRVTRNPRSSAAKAGLRSNALVVTALAWPPIPSKAIAELSLPPWGPLTLRRQSQGGR